MVETSSVGDCSSVIAVGWLEIFHVQDNSCFLQARLRTFERRSCFSKRRANQSDRRRWLLTFVRRYRALTSLSNAPMNGEPSGRQTDDWSVSERAGMLIEVTSVSADAPLTVTRRPFTMTSRMNT